MDGGPERIADRAERATVAKQALRVHAQALTLVALLAAAAYLWP